MDASSSNQKDQKQNQQRLNFSIRPGKIGLYEPTNMSEDACGVGFIANFKSQPSHSLVKNALTMLARMDHRGGCGCEANTGDGAGVMVGIPHSFMVDVARTDLNQSLPPFESYAVGNIFFSNDPEKASYWRSRVEYWLEKRGINKLGWRVVPTSNSNLGPSALRTEPHVEQLFATKNSEWDSKKFDLELYIVKQCVMREAQEKAINKQSPEVYICSLSCRTMVYKGLLTAPQVPQYYLDLQDPRFAAHFALVHSRFSTNTFPSWDRAHPNRVLCHNGEINTLRGNKNYMYAREGVMKSPYLGAEEMKLLSPICSDLYSDSGNLDAVLELLIKASDRSLPEAVMMMLPEAWQHDNRLDDEKRAFYEYNSNIMEPWDGPAMIAFSDGRYLGCTLDRNGLRPHRYYVTDDLVVAASEVGVIPTMDPSTIREKGRLMPGKMFIVDFARQSIIRDAELKRSVVTEHPYRAWLIDYSLKLNALVKPTIKRQSPEILQAKDEKKYIENLNSLLTLHGYTTETLEIILPPMVDNKQEALGSMGVDSPLACLSSQPRDLYDYFKELFAQVTNPPMDSIREEIVMAMECPIGPEGNLLSVTPEQAERLILLQPILSPQEAQALIGLSQKHWKTIIIDTTYPATKGSSTKDLNAALNRICGEASEAISKGAKAVYLSDMASGKERFAIPALLAVGAVHQHLIRNQTRTKVAIVVEGGDIYAVHHHCCLLGYGADAIYPYMAYEALRLLCIKGKIAPEGGHESAIAYYVAACGKGIRKVMGKIGISTVQSYKSAQIFEAVGIGSELIDRCFTGTPSRIGGIGLDIVHADVLRSHTLAYPRSGFIGSIDLPNPGEYHYRFGGEEHFNSPAVIVGIQRAAIDNSASAYDSFAAEANAQARKCTLRGLLRFKSSSRPFSVDDVEPAKEIVRRFVTGAMSFGSISKEAHETLAIAMNRIGAKSNTGEGGEDPARFTWKGPNGESKRSSIKQVASGRFGVSSNYLTNADEIQIKMAQGAKPGEGGELPGHKVMGEIPITRRATEGVGLISPPPHHDIYSIEDLAQLIHDLKNANTRARISVKLVSEVGVGVVAAGVAKAKADHIVISGHDGGTGAAAWTGIKHSGLPWELGVAEAQQTLVLNGLRGRVVLQTDGQLKTGRDVAIAFLLGAEEVGFATAPLIALGCIMMRKCHLNTCPVGIATQDPELRAKFSGKPEHVINYLFMVAEECRKYMAQMGFRTVEEMIGRCDMLEPDPDALTNTKLKSLDLSNLIIPATELVSSSPIATIDPDLPIAVSNSQAQDHGLDEALDRKIIDLAKLALGQREKVKIKLPVSNLNRSVGAMLSNEVSRRFGERGLPEDTIRINLFGSVGQSAAAFLAPGITIVVEGDANDYVGKGLSGGVIAVYPPPTFKGDKSMGHMIVGNVCLYGAISGKAYFSGMGGERFAVRNSGAVAVVEGVGDHGCEYMTGGRVIILGETGRNFGAGMSGGLAFVFDKDGKFRPRCNLALIEIDPLSEIDEVVIRDDIASHIKLTGSEVAQSILDDWYSLRDKFVKVYPKDLKRVIREKLSQPGFSLPFWMPEAVEKLRSGAKLSSSNTVKRNPTNSEKVVLPMMMKQGKNSNIASSVDLKDIEDSNVPSSSSSSDESTIKPNKTSSTVGPDEKPGRSRPYDPTQRSASVVRRRDGTEGPINKLRGFVEYERSTDKYRKPLDRLQDWGEINLETNERPASERVRQAARCMDCGTPFCQTYTGCPINNHIPNFNQLYFEGRLLDAHHELRQTNPFPEFTGRVCPAPCEGSCVAGLVDDPVTIKNIEYAIIDNAWSSGWVAPRVPQSRSGLSVAIIGSGPAGLACAEYLNRVGGHKVTVFERADRIGGLLMYGIPTMKLSKETVQRRVDLLAAEGIEFVTNANVGVDPKYDINSLRKSTSAIVLAVGATKPRDLPVTGRGLNGVHFAMDFLSKNTKTLLDDGNGRIKKWDGTYITAAGKNVVVIGGGDTGCDCIGTSLRHGCKSLVNFELLPKPPAKRATNNPWPEWPVIFRTDYGHEEVQSKFGKDPREFCVLTKRFVDDGNGNVCAIETVLVDWTKGPNGKNVMTEIPGSERQIPADLVILALGFLGPDPSIVESIPGLKTDGASNIKATKVGNQRFKTSVEGVFSIGDARRGQSLVVHAINEGIESGEAINQYLALLSSSGISSSL